MTHITGPVRIVDTHIADHTDQNGVTVGLVVTLTIRDAEGQEFIMRTSDFVWNLEEA